MNCIPNGEVFWKQLLWISRRQRKTRSKIIRPARAFSACGGPDETLILTETSWLALWVGLSGTSFFKTFFSAGLKGLGLKEVAFTLLKNKSEWVLATSAFDCLWPSKAGLSNWSCPGIKPWVARRYRGSIAIECRVCRKHGNIDTVLCLQSRLLQKKHILNFVQLSPHGLLALRKKTWTLSPLIFCNLCVFLHARKCLGLCQHPFKPTARSQTLRLLRGTLRMSTAEKLKKFSR